jgi:Flp pilus assembly protein TadG
MRESLVRREHGGRTRRARRRARPGQALVEFALVAPIFVLLVIGVFELGRAWTKHQTLSDAAREAARAWASSCTVTGDTLRQRVVRHLRNAGVDTAGLQVNASTALAGCSCAPPSGTSCPDSLGVQAVLPHPFTFLSPVIGWTGAATSVTLTGESWMPQIR